MGPYKKLKLKIKEVFDTQEEFAKAMNMSRTSLNLRLNEGVEWRMSEIVKACELLGIPLEDAFQFFLV